MTPQIFLLLSFRLMKVSTAKPIFEMDLFLLLLIATCHIDLNSHRVALNTAQKLLNSTLV